MKSVLRKIFNVEKPIIGMLHLGYLEGEKFLGIDSVVKNAIYDIKAMQDGGIDGIIIENWYELSVGEFVSEVVSRRLFQVVRKLRKYLEVPFGFNILNNDYKTAFKLSRVFGASFVELDTFVDDVESDFSTNTEAASNPFMIYPKPSEIVLYAKNLGLVDFPIFAFVHPKHYKMLDKTKSLEDSVKQAVQNSVAGILITKETGFAPTKELILRAKAVSGEIPVGIGSGFSVENARDFLQAIDFVVVGSSLKKDGVLDNPVDQNRVKCLINVACDFRL